MMPVSIIRSSRAAHGVHPGDALGIHGGGQRHALEQMAVGRQRMEHPHQHEEGEGGQISRREMKGIGHAALLPRPGDGLMPCQAGKGAAASMRNASTTLSVLVIHPNTSRTSIASLAIEIRP